MGSSSLCGAAIQLRRLPQNTTRETLRSMLLFSDKLIDARLVENSYPEDEGFCTAIAHFSTTDAADHARGMLNGKDNTTRDSKMIVSTLHTQSSDTISISRRNTVGHASPGVMDDPAMPPLARQVSRFNDAFRSKGFSENGTSANGNFPTPSTEVNSPFYLAQPPVGAPQDRPRVTGKSVIDQDPDDETGDLIRDAVGYFRNGLPGSIDSPRRSTESSVAMRVSGLSLSTNINPSAMPPQGNPRSAMSFSSPSSSKTPSSISGSINSAGATPGFQPQSRKFRYHAPPANHADQNPPCNTLYVGNLQPDTSEDELKSVFSKQRGYKRLCFRPKPGNSPMCFVEFHDISSATKALYELYGVELSNSGSRGGIRLSFSKNPLGVRGPSNNVNGNPPAPRNGHSGAGPPLFTTASGPPPGLAAPPNMSIHGGSGMTSPHSAIGSTPTNGTFPMSNGLGPSQGPLANTSANGAFGLSNGIGSPHNSTPPNGGLSMGSGIGPSLNSLDTTTANTGLSLLNGVGHNPLGNAPTSAPLPVGNGMGATSSPLVGSPTNGVFNLNSGLGGFQPLRSPPINGNTGFFPTSPNPGSPNANSFTDYLGGR